MIFPMLGNWFTSIMAKFFVGFLDTVAYTLLVTAYNIFYAISQLDLFGGGSAGEVLYDTITSRIYGAISIVMIFVFAYQLIMLIVDPDGKEKKSQTALIKDSLISFVVIILLPTVFKYMSMFQSHVLEDKTIQALISGTGNGASDQNPGKQVALMTLISFYHPEGTSYDTFYDNDGLKGSDEALTMCKEQTAAYSSSMGGDGGSDDETCQRYYDALAKWERSNDIAVGSITTSAWLHDRVGDQMEYMWILSTAAAVICAIFFISYAIDMGTRAVKLGVLQLIAPIPVILRIFPQTKKTYETWFGEIKKTYLEVFIRLAVIFFILELIKLIPLFIQILFQADDGIELQGIAKGIAIVALILGMLKFAKDAPELFKTLFSNGGNLLSGLNLKPGVKKRMEDNTYAMKGLGAGLGAIGGAASRFATQYKKNKDTLDHGAGNNSNFVRKGFAALGALSAIPRGVISGGRNGLKNSSGEFSRQGMMNNFDQGVVGSQNSYRNARFQATRENLNNFINQATNGASNQSLGETVGNLITSQRQAVSNRAGEITTGVHDRYQNFANKITGSSADYNTIQTNANTITSGIDSLKKLAETKTKESNSDKTKLEARLSNAVDHTAEIAGKESMKASVAQKINQLNSAKTSYEQEITRLQNEIASGNLDIGARTQRQERIAELKVQIKDVDGKIENSENQIMQIDTEIKVMQDDPNSRQNIKAEIDSKKAEILAQQTQVYNQKSGERAQMAANLEKLIYSTGFSNEVMQELNDKVQSICGQNADELIKAFKDQNNHSLTTAQAKAMHSMSDIIKQAGIDAGLMSNTSQSKSSGSGSNSGGSGDKK